jgi:hypothetical protein
VRQAGVETAVPQPDDLLGPEGADQVHVQSRKPPLQMPDQRGEDQTRHETDGQARPFPPRRPQAPLQRLGVVQQVLCLLPEQLPRRGQPRPRFRAVEQLRLQLTSQRRDRAAEGGLGDVQNLGARRLANLRRVPGCCPP